MKIKSKLKLLWKFLFFEVFKKLYFIDFMSLTSDKLDNFVIFIDLKDLSLEHVHHNQYYFKEYVETLT